MNRKVLIVEDAFIEANNLQIILERAGHSVCTIADSVEEAQGIIRSEKPELVLLDIFLKGRLTGIDLAKELRKKNIPFVYLSANSSRDILDAAKETHPYGFLIKPFREKDVLVALDIACYLHEHSLESRLRKDPDLVASARKLAEKKQVSIAPADAIIGKSETMRRVMNYVDVVAGTDTSVLILGESGTGKEKIASAIHQLSARRNQPMIKVNCAALPANLIESELFGHEKGAFTGAHEKRIGKFEQADGGTIFLDEVGEIPVDLQAKLLRVLQEREIEPLGGKRPVKINIRIIAATNRNLEKEIAEGRFRIDLYYRLNVFPIVLPALRERKEDIPDLVHHFVAVHCKRMGKPVAGIGELALKQLMAYSWPGNIRELENVMERNVLLSSGSVIENHALPRVQFYEPTLPEPMSVKTLEEIEREAILSALKKTNGKVFGNGGAAELLGLNVSTLNARIKKLGIEKKTFWG
jgi:DNA-binding NtrC family response regulator